jgi:hypothetical protein
MLWRLLIWILNISRHMLLLVINCALPRSLLCNFCWRGVRISEAWLGSMVDSRIAPLQIGGPRFQMQCVLLGADSVRNPMFFVYDIVEKSASCTLPHCWYMNMRLDHCDTLRCYFYCCQFIALFCVQYLCKSVPWLCGTNHGGLSLRQEPNLWPSTCDWGKSQTSDLPLVNWSQLLSWSRSSGTSCHCLKVTKWCFVFD